MDWQGIPFLLHQEKIEDTVRVALNSIPKIVIESPTDYTNAWITAGVSILAGLIPATIAIWTFKRNAENMRAEREHQQNFLREDRKKQQEFLESDRNKQQESFEQDRKTQIEIAKTNFDMQVLSGNRQSWINSLRDVVAEYTVAAPSLIEATNQFRMNSIHLKGIHKIIQDHSSGFENEDLKAEQKQATHAVELSIKKMNECNDKVTLLSSKILMMLNPKEDEYQKFYDLFDRIRKMNSELVKPEKGNELFGKHFSETVILMRNLVKLTQQILKTEWERVKQGV